MNNRKRKEKGIAGRSSKVVIDQRRKLGEQIIKKHNYEISKKDFMEKYKQELESTNNNFICPTPSTLQRDREAIVSNIKSQRGFFKFTEPSPNRKRHLRKNEIEIGGFVYNSIKEIRLSIKGIDMIFYKPNKYVDADETKYMNLISQFKMQHFTESELKDQSVHLYIIFNQADIEKYVAAFYKTIITPDHFLYIATHEYCTEFVFSIEHLELIMQKTYYILLTARNKGY